MRSAAAVLALLLLAAPAWSQDAGDASASERQPAFARPAAAEGAAPAARRAAGEVSVTPFFLYTGVVLLALVGALSLVKNVAARKNWLASSEAIQVVGRRALGPHQSLVLVEVGSRVLRVGVTKDSLVYLGETADAEEVARIKGQNRPAREEAAAPPFRKTLGDSAAALERVESEPPAPSRLSEVKRELASIRNAVLGWRSGARETSEAD